MSQPRVDGVSEAVPHPAMILWPSFKQMADEAGARGLAEHEEEPDSCSSCASDDDFEFAPAPRDADDAFAAQDFLFPVLDQGSLFYGEEERRRGTKDAGAPTPRPAELEQPSAEEDGRDGADFCLWRPKPRSEPEPPALEAAGKSMSTGGIPARSHPSPTHGELAATTRSRSDGAGRLRFLASPTRATPAKAAGDRPRRGEKKKVAEMDMATAHRLFYSKPGDRDAAGGSGGGHARRSYLPYRKDLVGFFAGGTRFLPF